MKRLAIAMLFCVLAVPLGILALIPIGAFAGYINPPPSSGFVASLAMIGSSTSAQLRSLLSDESGTGAALFANGAIGDATATSLGVSGTLGVTGAVAISGATTIVPSSGTALTLTGVSGATGLAIVGGNNNHTLTITGPPLGAFSAISILDGNGTTTAARFGLLITNWANTIGGAAIKIVTNGANGDGIISDTSASTGGYSLKLIPDATSPAFPAVLMTPQDTNPTNAAAIGALFMLTGGVLRTETATTPIWAAVANVGKTATLAAAGSVQSDATAITAGSDFYQATAANGTTGITLTQGGAGTCFRVMNMSASALKVYGHNSDNDTINGGSADAVYSQVAGSSLTYCTADGTAWLTY